MEPRDGEDCSETLQGVVRMKKVRIDNSYWSELQNSDGCTDPLAVVLHQLKGLQDYAVVINQILPASIERLETERRIIVKQTEKTFSDIMAMLDEFNDGEESSYETAVRLCEYYRKNKSEQ